MAASVYATQISTGGFPHAHGRGTTSPISNRSSATLVESTPPSGDPLSSSKFRVVAEYRQCGRGQPNGQPLYSISSDSKHTKLLSHRDNFEVATVDWDRPSPRMVFRGKKLKCKEWLSRARRPGPNTESRIFFHGDSQFRWMHQPSRGLLIPADRSGLVVAKWHSESLADGLRLQIFQEALVEPGLIEAIILSIVLLQSGHSLGDTLEPLMSMSLKHYGTANLS
ncbi:hypothetical protein EI94DRAFT_1811813 [Lactarius quietus]|nr:hypothetical protein EI94DRAFT_1811813 [Lactarius quietus]